MVNDKDNNELSIEEIKTLNNLIRMSEQEEDLTFEYPDEDTIFNYISGHATDDQKQIIRTALI